MLSSLKFNKDSMGIHRVENASSSDRAATLHFYFPVILMND